MKWLLKNCTIYLGFLSLLLKVCWLSESFQCDTYAKNKKNQEEENT